MTLILVIDLKIKVWLATSRINYFNHAHYLLDFNLNCVVLEIFCSFLYFWIHLFSIEGPLRFETMSNQVKFLLVSALTLHTLHLIFAERFYTIDNIIADSFEGRTSASFNLTHNDGIYLMNAVIHLLKPITNYMVQIEGISVPVIGPRITFLNRTVNACRMLKKKNSNDFIFVFFVNAIKRHSNTTLSCPLGEGKYFFHNFQLDINKLPSLIPLFDQKILLYIRSYELHDDGSEENYLIIKANGTLKNKWIVFLNEKSRNKCDLIARN